MTEGSKAQHGWLWHVIVLSIGFLATYLMSTFLPGRRSEAYATFAALLQFIGVLTVAKGIADLRGELGLPSVWKELRDELREDWNRLRGRRHVNIVAGTGSLTLSGLAPTIKIGLAPGATLDQQLQHLQNQIDSLSQLAQTLDKRVSDEAKARADAITALSEDTERKREQLWDRVKSIHSGGIRLETVCLAWVAVGSILPAFPHLAYVLWPLM